MLIANNKPIVLIGFLASTVTQEIYHFVSKDWQGELLIMSPDEFLSLPNKFDYQYMVAFTLDTEQRIEIIQRIDHAGLDCIKYAHDSVVHYTDIDKLLGAGSCIMPFSSIFLNGKIGKHCYIEANCLIAHYTEIGDNVILHAGTMIAGKTKIGDNSVFNFKSSAINNLDICGGIEVGATSTLTKNIDQPGYYVGTPARRIGNRKTFEHV
jgi:acetyltransferase-like isoleucine patch superfamily enzyme